MCLLVNMNTHITHLNKLRESHNLISIRRELCVHNPVMWEGVCNNLCLIINAVYLETLREGGVEEERKGERTNMDCSCVCVCVCTFNECFEEQGNLKTISTMRHLCMHITTSWQYCSYYIIVHAVSKIQLGSG